MKQYIRGYDLARCGLGGPVGLGLAQRCLGASKRLWSEHGTVRSADLATRKIVSRNRRFVIAPVPKVGTKTLKVMLQQLGSDSASDIDITFMNAPLHVCLDDLGPDYAVFSLVRNPWSRALSCYRNKIRSTRLGDLAIRSRYAGLDPGMSFPDFVRWLDRDDGRDETADRHWISQSRLLTHPETGHILCTRIGKFESFQIDVEAFLRDVGLGHLEILHINQTAASRDPTSYRTAYDAETRDIIRRRYRSDIEMFGYDF
ncbi:MAG: sulfotransferase family 2 domain-containing protein [Geminicoccaceae bacterium]